MDRERIVKTQFHLQRWPFNWKTPSGYLVAWLAQLAGIACIFIVAITFFGIIFGSSWLFIVIAKDISNDMAAFNQTVEKPLKGNDRKDAIKRFSDIVQKYSDAKELILI